MARWSDEVDLVSLDIDDSGDDGYDREVEVARTTVYANRRSCTRSEFYQAASAGMNADITFEVRMADYADQVKLYWNDKPYRVLRTYEVDDDTISLVCSDLLRRFRANR